MFVNISNKMIYLSFLLKLSPFCGAGEGEMKLGGKDSKVSLTSSGLFDIFFPVFFKF